MQAVYIYALKDPTTGQTRYIGVTTRPKKRLKEHLLPSRVKENSYRACWIRSLVAQGISPEIEFLAQAGSGTWEQDEIDYIAAFRSMGCVLTNDTDGGGGTLNPSPAVRAKISAAKIGKPPWNKGKVCPQLSAAQSGDKNHMFGKPAWNKGKSCPEVSAKFCGEKNPRFGKPAWNRGMKNGKRE